MTKKNKLSSQKRLAIAGFFAIFIALLFMISSVPAQAGTGNHQQETGFTAVNYIPQPQLNSNITWSTYNSQWTEFEYYNGTHDQNLSVQQNNQYRNPITIDPADIIATGSLQNNEIAGKYWDSTTNTTYGANSGVNIGTVAKEGTFSTDKAKEIYITSNTTKASNTQYYLKTPIASITQYPSSNLEYDYLTAGYELHGPALTGAEACIMIINQTGYKTIATTGVNEPFYISENFKQIEEQTHIGLNITGKGKSDLAEIHIMFTIPKTSTDNHYNLTLNQLALTDYGFPIGTNSTGKEISEVSGNALISKFAPPVKETIINNGYTVATSENMQNETISQTSINSGNFIEQATYQGTFSLPTAPDLSYSETTITMNMSIPGTQFEVANLNGISYLSQIQTKTNGTFTFGTVNPNQQNGIILETKFTASQWNASTNAPSIFSLAGIEYYWWVGLIGLMSVIGLGAAASSHFSGDEENLKIPKGKFGR